VVQRPDGGQDGPPSDYVDVDVDSLAEGGQILAEIAASVRAAQEKVIPPAIEVLDAIPQASDLFSAYAFCWGRWSAVFDSSATAVDACAKIARDAAAGYRRTDKHLTPQ
jgi:hypothetical protein